MRRLFTWLLAPVVLAAAVVLAPTTSAEAARWRGYVGYSAYYAPYAYGYRTHYAPYAYRYGTYYRYHPRVRVYRPVAPVVVYPGYGYVAAPGGCYGGWW